METLFFLIIVVTMWPLVSAAKLYECYRVYSLPARAVSILFTILGAVAWFAVFAAGIDLYIFYGTMAANAPTFFFFVFVYTILGVSRYALFWRYDRDTEYERLVEQVAHIPKR